jgi:hypothetical protein
MRRSFAPISTTVAEPASSIQSGASASAVREGQILPLIFAAQVAGAELVRVDLRVGGKKAEQERFLRHFEAENRDGLFPRTPTFSAMFRAKRRFSHRGARRQDQQFGRLQAGREVVELVVTGRQARDAFAFFKDLRDALVFAHHVAHSHEAQAHAILGQLENRGLRAVENRIGVVLGFERLLLNGVVAWISRAAGIFPSRCARSARRS